MFKFKEDNRKKAAYTFQTVLIIIFQFACFLSIVLRTGEVSTLIFCGLFQLFMLIVLEVIPFIYKKISRLLLNNSCMFLSIGLIMLVRLNFSTAIKQLVIAFSSFLIASFIPYIMCKLKKMPVFPYLYATIGIGMLFFVALIEKIGISFSFFGFSIIPAEFVKILFVLFLACALYKNTSFKNLVISTLLSAAHILILAVTGDLGNAFILFVVYVIMIFVATRKYRYLILGGIGLSVISVISYFLFNRIRLRISAFLDPFSVIENEGYQITQSLFAISNGSWFGVGLYNGTPDTIPYVETDLIFSIIAQEFGIIFSMCLVLIGLSTLLIFIDFAIKCHSPLFRLISFGLGFTYGFQFILSIAGVTGFIPLSGITLPLVSHGGSSVMATLMSFFLLEGMIYEDETYSKYYDAEWNIGDEKEKNKFISAVFIVISLLYVLVSVYYSSYAYKNREKLINNSHNPYQSVIVNQVERGTIYSRDYEILAETVSGLSKQEVRVYPLANIFSHVVGYCGNGSMGLENTANYYLINTNQPISDRITSDISGKKYIGDSIVTTLNTELQMLAYNSIGTYSGAIIVTNSTTGEILALVSKPDFDPNSILDIWDTIVSDKDSSVLVNRVTQGKYDCSNLLGVDIINTLREIEGQNNNTSESNSLSLMQINKITGLIANEGVYAEPYLVSKVINSNMNTVKDLVPQKKQSIMSLDDVNKQYSLFKKNADRYYKSTIIDSLNGQSEDLLLTGFTQFEDSVYCVTIVLENAGPGNNDARIIADRIFDYFK